MSSSPPLSEYCVYTIVHVDLLDEVADRGGPASFSEARKWSAGFALWQEARANGVRFPVVLGDATDCRRLMYWGVIDEIRLEIAGTHFTVDHLRPLPQGHSPGQLTLKSTGRAISPGYIRPYAVCRTPAFLIAFDRRGNSPRKSIPPSTPLVGIEGDGRLAAHLRRERNPALARAKKSAVLKGTGRLCCEACGFDFSSAYGELGSGFCEVHHLKPLSEASGPIITTLGELAVVCANCHRMLHRSKPMMSIGELSNLVFRLQKPRMTEQ